MRGFAAVFILELRKLARSKTLAVLAAFSVAWTAACRYLVTGDGTAEGFHALYARYSLGVVFAVAAVSFSAAAAGSLAKDRRAKILMLSLVRPADRFALVAGRLCAIAVSAAAVLGASCLVYCHLSAGGGHCSLKYAPELEDPRIEAGRLYESYMADYPDFREKARKMPKRDIMRFLVRHVESQYDSVPPGGVREWRFPSGAGGADAVRVRLTEMFGRLENLSGTFSIGSREGAFEHLSDTVAEVALAEKPGASGDGALLVLKNTGKASISLNPRTDLLVLERADAESWNVLRAFIVLVSLVTLVSALGLALGACLSRSVAVFSMISLIFVMAVSPSVSESYPDPLDASAADRAGLALSDFSAAVAAPFNSFEPVSSLAEGFAVGRAEVAKAVVLDVLVLPGMLCALAAFAVSRKTS